MYFHRKEYFRDFFKTNANMFKCFELIFVPVEKNISDKTKPYYCVTPSH